MPPLICKGTGLLVGFPSKETPGTLFVVHFCRQGPTVRQSETHSWREHPWVNLGGLSSQALPVEKAPVAQLLVCTAGWDVAVQVH